MKDIKYLLLLAIVSFFTFSSCTVQKRLYNPGYHVQWNESYSSVKEKENVAEKKNDSQKSIQEPEEKIKSVKKVSPTENNAAVYVEKSSKTIEKETYYNNNDVASSSNEIQPNSFSKTSFSKSFKNAINNKVSVLSREQKDSPSDVEISKVEKHTSGGGSGSSDAMFVVLVILCFFPFINLIPVYLHDGKNITLNFWVTLILDLLTIVGGIIMALLVVLDIVSL